MTYFAETTRLYGRVEELDVFADEDERDRWGAEGGDGTDENGEGPRTALDEATARDRFRDEDGMPVYPWVRLHAGVRPSGMRNRRGTVQVPDWMDLDDFTEQHNDGLEVDWSKDVTLVWDGWSNR